MHICYDICDDTENTSERSKRLREKRCFQHSTIQAERIDWLFCFRFQTGQSRREGMVSESMHWKSPTKLNDYRKHWYSKIKERARIRSSFNQLSKFFAVAFKTQIHCCESFYTCQYGLRKFYVHLINSDKIKINKKKLKSVVNIWICLCRSWKKLSKASHFDKMISIQFSDFEFIQRKKIDFDFCIVELTPQMIGLDEARLVNLWFVQWNANSTLRILYNVPYKRSIDHIFVGWWRWWWVCKCANILLIERCTCTYQTHL